MKTYVHAFLLIAAFFLTTLSGCQIIGDIFKAGIFVGIIVVVVVIALIAFIFRKMSNRN